MKYLLSLLFVLVLPYCILRAEKKSWQVQPAQAGISFVK